ncbi:hypothetical protein ACTMU2_37290 [Cupriavidus basilensis]
MFPLAGLVAFRLAWQGLWQPAFQWVFSLAAGTAVILIGKLAFELGGWSVPSANMYQRQRARHADRSCLPGAVRGGG